jgi:hypothetical protein
MQLEPNYNEDTKFFVGYQISTVVAMKSSLFQHKIALCLLYADFLLSFLFSPAGGGGMVV